MKTRYSLASLLLALAPLALSAQAKPAPVEVSIDVSRAGGTIHPFMYGMFTELLSNMFENGLWAEMLSDRKFFYPVDTTAQLAPRNSKRHQNRWRPMGEGGQVVMDSASAYVGRHSPRVLATGLAPAGIRQGGMWLRKGAGYEGRVVLRGEPGMRVEVSLVWGASPAERQTLSLEHLTEAYAKYPLRFVAGGDTQEGYLEIVSRAKGAFGVGAVSLMPADNCVQGFRKDMIDILRQMDSGVYRWPGGNFVANYDWRHGIGDADKRPPRYDYAWNTVESNDVGTDEFITLCRLICVEPYICVNIGLGDAFSAAQWVEYCNGLPNTPMGSRRASNGHTEPYGVRYWGIGNEMYGQWQIGHMSVEHYSIKHNLFAEEMRAVDPNILFIASGATIYEAGTTARHHRQPLYAKLPYDYLSPDDWSGNLLKGSLPQIDYLAEHIYSVFNGYFDGERQAWVNETGTPLLEQIRRTPSRIKGMVEALRAYEARIEGVKEKKLSFWVDEWVAGGGRGFGNTLGVAFGLHELFRHSGCIMMGAFTGFTSLYASNDVSASMSSKGLLFKLYRERLGSVPVAVEGRSPLPPLKGTVGVDIPTEPAGVATWPLDVLATVNEARTKLTIAIVNPTDASQTAKLDLGRTKVGSQTTLYLLATDVLTNENRPGEAPLIGLRESRTPWLPELSLPPYSISLYELDIK
jgi:alpha-N-arabinofuranosidase